MTLETWSTFVVVWFAFVAFPGPNSVYVMAVGSRRGLKAAVAAACGFALAVAVYVTLVGFGLLAFLAASATAFEALRWLGVGYLGWLAWQAWRAPAEPTDLSALTLPEARGVFSRAALVSLTNPKSALSYILVYPSFLGQPGGGPAGASQDLVILGVTSVALCLVIYTLYGAAAGVLGRLVRTRRQALIRGRAFAAVFAAGGLALAFAERR